MSNNKRYVRQEYVKHLKKNWKLEKEEKDGKRSIITVNTQR